MVTRPPPIQQPQDFAANASCAPAPRATPPKYRSVAGVIRRFLQDRLDCDRSVIAQRLHVQLGVTHPSCVTPSDDGIDQASVRRLSVLVRKRELSLVDTVRLVRGETAADPRPNKALDPDRLHTLLDGYAYRDLLVSIAQFGFAANWRRPVSPQRSRPMNHKSAIDHQVALLRSVRRGQDAGEYLVVALDVFERWRVHSSPFGAVPKSGIDPALEVRLIHDLSFPRGQSPNDFTEKSSLPVIVYEHVARLAERIESEHHRLRLHGLRDVDVLMLKGDVKGAFRHLRSLAQNVRWMGASFPELGIGVVDLAAPFGWTGSPAFYGAFGRAISFLVANESPASMCRDDVDARHFFAYEWVDDHIMIEADVGNRCAIAVDVLRLAMLAVLGPEAINDAKFSVWSHSVHALGLAWDTKKRMVSMPTEKVQKALQRVVDCANGRSASRTQVQQVLGSLRHVCSCLRAAKPFYQNLAEFCCQLPRSGRRAIPPGVYDDLAWFTTILRHGQLQGLPTRLFCNTPPIDVHLYMDASDHGLVVLDPRWCRFIHVEFDKREREAIARRDDSFPINVREQLCIALACTVLGPSWKTEFGAYVPHIRCWSDNTSAVAWTNRLRSPSPLGQVLNKMIGLASSRSPSVATVHVSRVLHDLQGRSLATSSRRAYDRSWHEWSRWCSANGVPEQLPRSRQRHSNQLIHFAIDCWRQTAGRRRVSASTIVSRISHISWHHLVRFGYRVGLHDGHQLAVRGMRRCGQINLRKQPVNRHIMLAIRRQLNLKSDEDRVTWGAAVLGFFFLLRRSEYLQCDGKVSHHAITKSDVTFEDGEGRKTTVKRLAVAVELRFRSSKTDQFGQGEVRRLQRSGDKKLCPVRAAWALWSQATPTNALLCSLPSGKCTTSRTMSRAIKRGAASIGQNPDCFGTHSLRSGGATTLFGAGISDTTIKQLGRWSSDCFQRYTRIEATAGERIARAMVQSR